MSAVGSSSKLMAPLRFIFSVAGWARRKSATAAALMIMVASADRASTARRISSALSTRAISAPVGASSATGPLTKITRAPRRSAASASA